MILKSLLSFLGLVFLTTACGAIPVAQAVSEESTVDLQAPWTARLSAIYPDLGPAPEFQNEVWLNTDVPLRLKDLRGKVVLLDMWTFDCVNCQDVVPSLRAWYQKYSSQGLVIIGNHYPETNSERSLINLKESVQRLQIDYPVAQDNSGATWSAYHSEYWPTAYLIDKRGHIRYLHIGEGDYPQTEAAIQALLSEPAG